MTTNKTSSGNVSQNATSSEAVVLRDVRVPWMALECLPVKDRDAVISIVVRDHDEKRALSVWLSGDDARTMLAQLIEALS